MTTGNPILSPFLDTIALSPLKSIQLVLSLKNPSCIDLLLRSFKPSFMKRNVLETGIYENGKMISSIIKLHVTRESPKTKYYPASA